MRLRALIIVALAIPACGDERDDDAHFGAGGSAGGGATVVNPPPPSPGQDGPTLTYSSGHPLDWITHAPDVLSFEQDVVTRTNDHRVSMNLDALVHDPSMRRVARGHSRHMRADVHAFFDHVNPEGHGPADRLTLNGVSWTLAGENIAAGQASAGAAVTDWLASPGHRANIERPGFRRIGVGYQPGVTGDPYGHYWTQLFAD